MALPPETARMLSALEAFLDAHHFLATSAASVAIITLLLTTILFCICVMPRAYDHFRGGLYVDGHPAGSHEDAVSVYCTLCGSWLGWRIIEKITLDDEYWVGPKVELFPINKGEVYMFKYWVASHPLLVKCAKLQ
ncbi:hypothetical protein CK203_064535 [Vitis vinifera]|uniref:Uncharacterized protein n=1 Tax=Vitis vinifera TaxID=29760 RepID=A0A438G7Z4_VITVI|nr:hypothetical protein CK203_064535 [Vitis vinifera]